MYLVPACYLLPYSPQSVLELGLIIEFPCWCHKLGTKGVVVPRHITVGPCHMGLNTAKTFPQCPMVLAVFSCIRVPSCNHQIIDYNDKFEKCAHLWPSIDCIHSWGQTVIGTD